jgi:hypothetical protein
LGDANQTLGDANQTLGDANQTLGDANQTLGAFYSKNKHLLRCVNGSKKNCWGCGAKKQAIEKYIACPL